METKVKGMDDLDVAKSKKIAAQVATRDKCDVFLYNGDIQRKSDLEMMLQINGNKKHDNCKLILITHGGDPDAGFKIARYLQERYKRFRTCASRTLQERRNADCRRRPRLNLFAVRRTWSLGCSVGQRGQVYCAAFRFEYFRSARRDGEAVFQYVFTNNIESFST